MQENYQQPIYTGQPEQKEPSKKNEILSTLGIIIIAPVVALLITAFVFQSYEVDGPSMERTLFNKDRLIVDKMPRTLARVTGHGWQPKRYEIVIFNHTEAYEMESVQTKQLIKRVVGVPGDRVVVKDNIVTVYNKEHPGGFRVDQQGPEASVIGITTANQPIDQKIQPGEVFVLGDNRPNSMDSRAFGPIEVKDLVGKLSVRVYPFNEIKRF